MLEIIIYLILVLAVAFIAANKNRSFIGWLLIGLFATPILAFILIIVLPEGSVAVEA